MQEPTITQLKDRNQMFFSVYPYGPDKSQVIERQGNDWVFRVETGAGTKPVYLIEPDYSLRFLRHD